MTGLMDPNASDLIWKHGENFQGDLLKSEKQLMLWYASTYSTIGIIDLPLYHNCQ